MATSSRICSRCGRCTTRMVCTDSASACSSRCLATCRSRTVWSSSSVWSSSCRRRSKCRARRWVIRTRSTRWRRRRRPSWMSSWRARSRARPWVLSRRSIDSTRQTTTTSTGRRCSTISRKEAANQSRPSMLRLRSTRLRPHGRQFSLCSRPHKLRRPWRSPPLLQQRLPHRRLSPYRPPCSTHQRRLSRQCCQLLGPCRRRRIQHRTATLPLWPPPWACAPWPVAHSLSS
mmetsp:Transcript_36591/g.96588  ORF Transcript_36591/g.96588 Transcript_36591/m.96588 type:complete len:231 (-) Transcript_36591:1544-2236(-)